MSEMTRQPVVRLRDGAVRGKAESGGYAFLGIPYAAPPFGANRMRPPQPVPPWPGERDATAFGPTVPKGDYPPQYATLFPEVVLPGDDCLNLNVWRVRRRGLRPGRRGVREHQLPAVRRGLPVSR